MRNRIEAGPLAVLFAALLGGLPASTAAQIPSGCYDWGQSADRMSATMESNWVGNLAAAVPSNTSDVCYDVLSAAHAGAELASSTCGIWWVSHADLDFDWGAMRGPPDVPSSQSTIALSTAYQTPAGVITPPDLRETMTHEAAHASLRSDYFRGRSMSDAAWNNLHQILRERAGACFRQVQHPGLGMRNRDSWPTPSHGVDRRALVAGLGGTGACGPDIGRRPGGSGAPLTLKRPL